MVGPKKHDFVSKSIHSKEIIAFKKCQNLTFQSESSELFIQLKSNNLEPHFGYNYFLSASIFDALYFIKSCPFFDVLSFIAFTKYNNFL